MNKWKKVKREKLGSIPQTASENLQAPETAPIKKKESKSERDKHLGFKTTKKIYRLLNDLALDEDKFIVDVIEEAVTTYSQKSTQINEEQLLKELEKRIKENKIAYSADGRLIIKNSPKKVLDLGKIEIK